MGIAFFSGGGGSVTNCISFHARVGRFGIDFVLASPRVPRVLLFLVFLVFLYSTCSSVPRVPLFHVFVSEVLVSSAIGSPEYRSIQRRL